MLDDESKTKRVAELIRKAQYARRHDANQDAADAVQEALSLDPENEDARKLFEGLSLSGGDVVNVLQLCQNYYEGALDEASFRNQLQTSAIDIEGTQETIEFAFGHQNEKSDRIVDLLLEKANGKRAIIPLLLEEPTRTFKALWDLGGRSLRAVINKLLLQPGSWSKEADRQKGMKDMLLLLMAKLLQAGVETPEMAMQAIARLLVVECSSLLPDIDSDSYVIFFEALNPGNTPAHRTQATVVLAKLHEADAQRWERELTAFVETMAQTQWTEKLINACAAVSMLFPIAPNVCANMFLREGFVQQLMQIVNNSKNVPFKGAVLELLSSACVNSECRKTIKMYCEDWLNQLSADEDASHKPNKLAVTAVLVNSKIRDEDKGAGTADDKLVRRMKNAIVDKSTGQDAIEKAIEGLSYQSVHAKVKENLANDEKFLKQLVGSLSKPEALANGSLLYAGLTIFQNLTRYPPVISPEDRKIAELKAYANHTSIPKTHPLDEDGPVSERCSKVLDASLATCLVPATKNASLGLHTNISSIVLALSKHPRHRGRMARDGLFDLAMAQASLPSDNEQQAITLVKRQASLSFARIMIPVDPTLLMKGRDVRAAVRILLYLMKLGLSEEDSNSDVAWWRGFPVVSAVQALTNLAAYQPSPSNPAQTSELIVSECWPVLEDLWTSNAVQIRTCVTQCFVNLIDSGPAIPKFESDGGRSDRRIRILAGYWSEEDGALAEAAGGALATLLGAGPTVVERFLKTDSGIQSTCEWMRGNKPQMVHRAVVIVDELLIAVEESRGASELAKSVLMKLKKENAPTTLRAIDKAGQPWTEQVKHASSVLQRYGGT
ncbi:MAG: hypothetical protein Q9162_001397 [Coniocarpon cinnabarinum]